MPQFFDSKAFNPRAFGAYTSRVPNLARNELAKCGAIGKNHEAAQTLRSQTGSLYTTLPYFGRISAKTSQNNDGATDIKTSSTSTFTQGFVTASRMDSWTERNFSTNITSGVDFMSNVAAQISEYKLAVEQMMLHHILKGVFSMDSSSGTVSAREAGEFIEKHTLDVTGEGDGCVKADTLNKAIQRASGDNKNIFKLAIMHSEVATNLENLRLIKYLTYTDGDGITRDLALGSWNGRTVLIDDNMPTKSMDTTVSYVLTSDTELVSGKTYYYKPNANYSVVAEPDEEDLATYYEQVEEESGDTQYTTYLLGLDSIILDPIGDSVPYEMSRDPKKNGGQDTLYVRDRYVCGVDGISFVKPPSLTASASNLDLSTGANWSIINNETQAISHKAIGLARILSYG